ncbi:HalOD1 output domain-containing protein [Halopiger djelfimassiliensis]|uniref:HalOD1 output domain-containing protein n=1 Tax=Halopiger djelfimassiliensis TaxID=1293047 RepID=UPI000677ECB8|nr:HalOD1 output domain-containing protein [Halopiger djelfimassiliensis]
MSSPHDTSSPEGEGPPTQTIIEAIADHEGVDVTEIEPPEYDPLYTVVNPTALDALFRTPARVPGRAAGSRVTFEYEGYRVVVYGDGSVDVIDPSSSDESFTRPIEE